VRAMPRHEFVEGTSSKFWDIKLAGASFTTTFGTIGANGQTQIKKFASPEAAKKEHDKLVAEKVKKGYELAAARAHRPHEAEVPRAQELDVQRRHRRRVARSEGPRDAEDARPVARHAHR
jgi:predicted DNA-binding WGR domain protein